jgi:cysteine-rich repeat protein
MIRNKTSLLVGLLVAGFACKADNLFMGEYSVDSGNGNSASSTGGQAGTQALGGSAGGLGGAAADAATTKPSIGTGGTIAISTATVSNCGNGIIDQNEQCDDGNTVNGDGCSSTCQVESGAVCATPGQLCKISSTTTCGDSKIDLGEECDDGNQVNGDGCSSTCKIESGFTCTTTTEQSPATTICQAICGDGIVSGAEECDLGSSNGQTSLCSNACKILILM